MKYKIKMEVMPYSGNLTYAVYKKSFLLWYFQTFESTFEQAEEYVSKLKEADNFKEVKL